MFTHTQFDAVSGFSHDIEAVNPAMVSRLRAQAASLDRYQIAAQFADSVTAAADAAHTRRWQEQCYGEASPDAIVDQEYYDELVTAWSLIAVEHQLISPETILLNDGSLH
jgi:hypothetical protein